MFVATKKFFLENRRKNGTWTSQQLKTFGVRYPGEKNWFIKFIGKPITNEQYFRFTLK